MSFGACAGRQCGLPIPFERASAFDLDQTPAVESNARTLCALYRSRPAGRLRARRVQTKAAAPVCHLSRHAGVLGSHTE
jgi:hypothetical protein